MKAIALAPALLLLGGVLARGYMIGPPMSLEELAGKSDVIFQGTVESNKTVNDPELQPEPGYIVQETVFNGVWLTKKADNVMPEGTRYARPVSGTYTFRHYAATPEGGLSLNAPPQSYNFQAGRTYLVFAKQIPDAAPGACRQIYTYPNAMGDEGVLLAADPAPDHGLIKDIVWSDLAGLLKSEDAKDVVYAIKHLDAFSGSSQLGHDIRRTSDFQRSEVLAAVHDLMKHADASVVKAAVEVVGSDNPYMTEESAQGWLTTVGSAEMPSYKRGDPHFVNVGGLIYWRELAAVADGKGDDATRALAVRALGLVREPSLESSVKRWLGDKSAAVRGSAALLVADYPTLATFDTIAKLACDLDMQVRISAAYAIGFTQKLEAIPLLVKLNADSNDKVRQAASQSLLAFSPKDPRVEKIFRENLANPETRPLVIVALGRQDPAANLDLLIDETAKKADPENWTGGQIPAYTASQLLFDYLKKQPAADLQSGKYDKALDALEIWKPNYAVDPQFVYALELKDGLKDRARKFRAAAEKAEPNESQFLDRAEKDPQQYLY